MKRKIVFVLSKIDLLIFLFSFFVIMNRYFIQDEYSFSLYFTDFMSIGLLYFILRQCKLWELVFLMLFIILGGIIQAVYGIIQLFDWTASLNSNFDISGSYFNPGPYSGLLSIVYSLSLGIYLYRGKIIMITNFPVEKNRLSIFFRFLTILGIILTIITILVTESRAAYLAVIASTCMLLFFKNNLNKTLVSLSKFKKLVILLSILIFSGIGLYKLYNYKKASADGRILIWKVSSEIVKENFFFGVGIDRFTSHYMNEQGKYFRENHNPKESLVADNNYYAFNEPLQLFVENGLFGFLLVFITCWFVLKIQVKLENKPLKIVCLGILFATFVFGLFSYPLQILPIKMIVIFGVVVMVNLEKNKTNYTLNIFNKNKRIKWYTLTSLFIVFFLVLFKVFVYTKDVNLGFRKWKIAMQCYNHGHYNDSLKEFETAYQILKYEGNFLGSYGKTLIMAGRYNDAIEILLQSKNYLNTSIIEINLGDAFRFNKDYKKAEEAYINSANMIPSRFYPHYLLVLTYQESGQTNLAKQKAKEILEKEVKVESTAIREIIILMRQILK
ncbi:O-antigen ligase family protein [Maribacter polysaccharolyticus]|uniref:O-antigen ligase family protein n=1 Tax=Maribacter polysaccharolyticus TaxID=3020831 RepID=UPI00237EFD2C|nr:O-antigen ligase family protein [Maribacter polysaccharolyticus]MDE3743988.1 O-antigen ligase family protein [Maribacter polysaccharolyticus]